MTNSREEYLRGLRSPQDAADEIVAEWRRQSLVARFAPTVRKRSHALPPELAYALPVPEEMTRRADLFRRVRAGDWAAERELWRRYRCRVVGP